MKHVSKLSKGKNLPAKATTPGGGNPKDGLFK